MDFKLRTRRFDDLTNWEIEQYLKSNDLIIVPVGNCETHAGLPVDCEGVAALGWAIMLAEKLDALYLPSLVYFNPGGTQIGRGTVHVSMEESYRYTKAIAHSLLNQGFKRQIWLPSHVPTTDFLVAMVTDFFDETKVPPLYLDINAYLTNMGVRPKMSFDPEAMRRKPTLKDGTEVDGFNDTMFGAYKLAGRLNAIPAKGEVPFPPYKPPKMDGMFPQWYEGYNYLGKCSSFMAAPAPYYYTNPDQHVGPPAAFYTREEIERKADIGIQYMSEQLDAAQLDKLMEAYSGLQTLMADTVHEHYDHLPKNKFSASSPF